MKTLGHIVLGTAVGTALALLFLISLDAWDHAHMYYPDRDNESAFLRAYDLKPLVEAFKDNSCNLSVEGGHSGGAAGRESTSHSDGFEDYFGIRVDRKDALMSAARDDIARWLVRTGARVLSQSGNPPDGFHFTYTAGKSIGSITIHPLNPAQIRGRPLPPGIEFIVFKIDIDETWYSQGVPVSAFASVAAPR